MWKFKSGAGNLLCLSRAVSNHFKSSDLACHARFIVEHKCHTKIAGDVSYSQLRRQSSRYGTALCSFHYSNKIMPLPRPPAKLGKTPIRASSLRPSTSLRMASWLSYNCLNA
jgi:hypothetical protein